jgi:uncharacterized protein YcbK (DUF882 family)
MKKFNNFTYQEFDSPDSPGSGAKFMSDEFITKLDYARDLAGIPFKINSGYRTKAHNKKVKGSPNSSHMKGLAADIHCADNKSRFTILTSLIAAGFNRIGIAKTFIHVDLDTNKDTGVNWLY